MGKFEKDVECVLKNFTIAYTKWQTTFPRKIALNVHFTEDYRLSILIKRNEGDALQKWNFAFWNNHFKNPCYLFVFVKVIFMVRVTKNHSCKYFDITQHLKEINEMRSFEKEKLKNLAQKQFLFSLFTFVFLLEFFMEKEL